MTIKINKPINPIKLLTELWQQLGVTGNCGDDQILTVMERPDNVKDEDIQHVIDAHDPTPTPHPWKADYDKIKNTLDHWGAGQVIAKDEAAKLALTYVTLMMKEHMGGG